MNEHTSRGHGGNEDAVDRAIDRAVRDIMSTEDPAGLRGRVLARLEQPAARSWIVPRLALAGAALAAILLAVVLMRPAPVPVDESRMVTAAPATVPPEAPQAGPVPEPALQGDARRGETPPSPDRQRRLTSTAIPMPRVTNVFGERSNRAAAAAAPIEDVVFAPATAETGRDERAIEAPPSIAVPALHVPALAIAPLRVEPLPARLEKDIR